jgi:3-hydroxymyristoyl/3-hydroxydecanoyl-(acyl carrier protein) dehydratase
MDAYSRAFSFVDRITSGRDGRRIRGRYAIPSELDDFPLTLVGEAIGQLAAWGAMAALGFTHRPVAGLAGRIGLLRTPRPGQVLELAADLETIDTDSVAYSGTAHVDDALVLSLADCVGPMMPVPDFDDPQALQARYARLCGTGAAIGGFQGLPRLALERTGGQPGKSVSATFQVPSAASLFADHFPRRPVFPGSLLMHANLQLAALLTRELPAPAPGGWVPASIHDMKLRSFIAPGTVLELEAKAKQVEQDSASLTLETRTNGTVIATASLTLKRREAP